MKSGFAYSFARVFLSFTRNNLRFVVRGVFGGSFVAVPSFLAARRVRLYPQCPNHVIFLENPSAPFVRSSCQPKTEPHGMFFALSVRRSVIRRCELIGPDW